MNELLDFCSDLSETERAVLVDNAAQIKDILYMIGSAAPALGLTVNVNAGIIQNVMKTERFSY